MELTPSTLEKVKCTFCKAYLSRAPIYLQHDDKAVCARCFSPDRPATRNTHYEALAMQFRFPCRNHTRGCPVTVPFVGEAEVPTHDKVCEYRKSTKKPPNTLVCSCNAAISALLFRDISGWKCQSCAPDKLVCANTKHGCTYTDIHIKCKKHEMCLCPQGSWCGICFKTVPRGTLPTHLSSEHVAVTFKAGIRWRATQTNAFGKFFLVSFEAGIAFCWYGLYSGEFCLRVYSPMSSEQLSEYRCLVRLIDPATGRVRTYTPQVRYDEENDWVVNLLSSTIKIVFPFWSRQFDIYIDITKEGIM